MNERRFFPVRLTATLAGQLSSFRQQLGAASARSRSGCARCCMWLLCGMSAASCLGQFAIAQEATTPAAATPVEASQAEGSNNQNVPAAVGTGQANNAAGEAAAVEAAMNDTSRLLQLEEQAFVRAAELAAPAVVQIETFGGIERVDDEIVAEGPTTGTILTEDGWIVSAAYGFRQQPASILVTLPDGKRASAALVARDIGRELAILKVESETPLPTAKPSDRAITVGSWTIALGKTYDKSQVSQSVGIISALGRAYGQAIQTDAKVSPINYGGPLIDLQGRVLGILAPISPGAFFEGDSSSLYDSGIGFAIPLNDILARLPRLQTGTDIHPGLLGVVPSNQNELAGPIRLAGVEPSSPAAKTGVKPEDVIVEAEGKPTHLLAEFKHALASVDAGQEFEFVVQRGEERLEMQTVLVQKIPVYRRRYLGMRVEASEAGLRVTNIDTDSPAAGSGLVVGDTLRTCNGQELGSVKELLGMVAVAELDQPLKFSVKPADTTQADKQLDMLAVAWPNELPNEFPPAPEGVDKTLPVRLVDLTLGDVSNKTFAVLPPETDPRPLGLLIVFPEPGELDREKTKVAWEKFCVERGWIVVVINSADPRSWSREEIELATRVQGLIEKSYRLDALRCVVGGFGVGGGIAMAAASIDRRRFSGALTLGTDLGRFAPRQRNIPLQSTDFLMVGKPEGLQNTLVALLEAGFVANVVPAADLKSGAWETVPMEPISYWLEGLGRL